MRNRSFACLTTTLATTALLVGACKQQPKAPAPAPPAAAVDPRTGPDWRQDRATEPLPAPLLYAAAKDGKTTFFLGTIHVGVDADRQLPTIVWETFDAAPTFAMETNLRDPAAASLMERSDGKTVHDDIGPVYFAKLESALTPAVAHALDRLKPAAALSRLQLQGLPATAPMDMTLFDHADAAKKKLVFLEPVLTQGAVLDQLLDARELQDELDHLGDIATQSKALLAAYLAGDEAKILASTEASRRLSLASGHTAAEFDAMMDTLLFERNRAWIAGLDRLHADDGAFVAVGAMHLVGPGSVLDLLGKRGYTIRRVSP